MRTFTLSNELKKNMVSRKGRLKWNSTLHGYRLMMDVSYRFIFRNGTDDKAISIAIVQSSSDPRLLYILHFTVTKGYFKHCLRMKSPLTILIHFEMTSMLATKLYQLIVKQTITYFRTFF